MAKAILKMIVVGDEAVGKTSLIIRHVDDRFATDYKPTLGFDISLKAITFEDTDVELLLWDIGGQDKFKLLRSTYLEGANGALIVYDVTRRSSFEHSRDWYRDLVSFSGKIPFILAGNKADLPEREVTAEDAEKLGQELGATKLIETSAKTGDNVNEAFNLLSRIILEDWKKKQ